MPAQIEGPPVAICPHGIPARLRYALRGRRLLRRSLAALTRASPALGGAGRAMLQARESRSLLEHLRVKARFRVPRPPSEPHVIVALHEGLADALMLLQLGWPLRFAARTEILDWPQFGPALRRMPHIPIDPERGAFRLARRLDMPLPPVVLTGTHRIWEHPFTAQLCYGVSASLEVLPAVTRDRVRDESPCSLQRGLERQMKAVALEAGRPSPRRYVPLRDGFWDGFAFDIDPAFPEVARAVAAHRRARCSQDGSA